MSKTIDPKTGIELKKKPCGNCPYHQAKLEIVRLKSKLKRKKDKIKELERALNDK